MNSSTTQGNALTNYISKKKLLIIFAATTLCLSACQKDLLNTDPYGSLGSTNMWSTDNLTDLGVNGVYQALRLNINSGGASGREMYHFDRFVTSQGRDADGLLLGNATTGNGNFSAVWQELYEGIHRANDALLNITAKSPSAANKKARLTAEVKYLRAYFYFRLNQLYKGVPIYLTPVTVAQTILPRATEEEVWKQVLSDLSEVINEGELPNRYTKGNANYGRITKSAAYALRGKVYLYTKQWELALADFQKVGDLGHNLFPNYANLFTEANEQADEMIFSIQNLPIEGFGSTTQFILGTRSAFGSNWNTYNVHNDLVDNYDNLDGSKFNWDKVIPGYSTMDVRKREVFFLRNNLTETEIRNSSNRGVDMSFYLPSGNEERIKQAYANRDPRLKANVITPYSEFLGRIIEGSERIFTSRWPHRNESGPQFDLTTDTRTFFYYLHRKFVYPGGAPIPSRTAGGIDFPLIRYADVVLMEAEALAELNRLPEAVAKVNTIRSRAGVGALVAGSNVQLTKEGVTTRIRQERRAELANEGISYFDELRWKTLKETVFYTGSGIKQIWGAVVIPYVWSGDELYTWAIPRVERERNTSLTQNPGWQD